MFDATQYCEILLCTVNPVLPEDRSPASDRLSDAAFNSDQTPKALVVTWLNVISRLVTSLQHLPHHPAYFHQNTCSSPILYRAID